MAEKKPVINVSTDAQSVEPVAASDLSKVAAEESFMHEFVTIRVHGTTDPNQPPYVVVSVNGVNQPILRERPQKIRRKYVEVLARMKETRYVQKQDPHLLEKIDLQETTALSYPFSVIDDTDKGKAWLQHILSEAA